MKASDSSDTMPGSNSKKGLQQIVRWKQLRVVRKSPLAYASNPETTGTPFTRCQMLTQILNRHNIMESLAGRTR